MYKLLLCWRYLRTRYIALASIISVTLGVATMIVVNSVMSGFTSEMQDRIHGILSDLTFERRSLDGMRDAEWHMQQIDKVAGESIAGMTATVVVPGMLSFQYGGDWVTRQVQIIGIDEKTQSLVSDFSSYLQHPANRQRMSFELHEDGYDTRDHQSGPDVPERPQMADAGWRHRRQVARAKAFQERLIRPGGESPPPEAWRQGLEGPERPSGNPPKTFPQPPVETNRQSATQREDSLLHLADYQGELRPVHSSGSTLEGGSRLPRPIGPKGNEIRISGTELPAPLPEELAAGPDPAGAEPVTPVDPFAVKIEADEFDPGKETHDGIVLGIALASFRTPEGEDRFLALPGDDVKLTLPTAGTPPKPISDNFTVVDLYESKMSEYDSSFVFVPIRKLQELRGMIDPSSGIAMVSSIQIKLKPGADGIEVRDKLRAAFAPQLYGIYTWRDKQGPLLAAVQMETAILNVLLFLIIAVAGFGILAIFLMIVIEKTRDIGILKSLGASGGGVMGIFLAYGLSLGLIGSGVGMVLGLLFVKYINEIAAVLGWITGRRVFDPSIYYFYKIPTIVSPLTIAWIVAGAMVIAVLASVLPALRAALLHPVEALRYE